MHCHFKTWVCRCPAECLPGFSFLFIGLFCMINALLTWVKISALNINCCKWLVLVWEMDCVLCEVGTHVFYTFYMTVSHQSVAAQWRHSYSSVAKDSTLLWYYTVLLDINIIFPVTQRNFPQDQNLHDGVPPHFDQTVTEYLYQCYGNCWIDVGGLHACLPHFPDLTPLDLSL